MKRIIIVLAILGAILLSSSLYTVNETQVAIKLRLGEIVSVENSPGLKFKTCLLYTSPSPRDGLLSRMPSSA